MVDAVGGVAKIVGVALKIKEAANTVHQNKKDCHHIKSRVDILNRTLTHHENNTELVEDSAVMAALEALEGILGEALEVITKCQEPRNIICVYYTAGNLSRRLSKVEQRITYLSSDVMLTIMSYQLLKKFQEGAPHQRPQTGDLGTHTPLQPPSPPKTYFVGRPANQDAPEIPSRVPVVPGDYFVGRPAGQGETAAAMARRSMVQRIAEIPRNIKEAVERVLQNRDRCDAGSLGEMTGEPRRSLVRRIAEVTCDIKEAVETVLQNRDECVEIDKCAYKVSTLLPQLEDTKMVDDPAMRGALEKLLAIFHRAHMLIIACQKRGLVIAWLSAPAGRLSTQLHEVLDQIASNIADMTAIVLP